MAWMHLKDICVLCDKYDLHGYFSEFDIYFHKFIVCLWENIIDYKSNYNYSLPIHFPDFGNYELFIA